MSKRVLLIAPYIHDFAAYDLWLKPLGLLYVAAASERAGYDVRVVNCLDRSHPSALSIRGPARSRSDGDGRGKFSYEVIAKPERVAAVPLAYKRYGIPVDAFRMQLAGGPPPDVIGVGSMMTYWYGGVAETVSVAHGVYPDVPVILGGVYATLQPEHAFEHTGADIVVEGPGEEQFVRILRNEIGGGNGGKTRPTVLRPAYHLLDNLDSVSMLTSYGCPFSCAYCASTSLRRGFLQRPVGDVVSEIVHYVRDMGMQDIAFYDDALLANANGHIKPVLREIAAMGLRVRFHTPNGLHANMIDRELAMLMKAAEFGTVRLSIESVDEARLKDSCMKVAPKGFEAAVSNLFAAGYAVGDIEAYVLMGVPAQSSKEVEETMRFVHETGAVIRLADFSPIPRTAYFDVAVETYGLDPREPLLQNSSVLPHLVPGMWDRYRKLRAVARSMNSALVCRTADTSAPG
jgi:radical SAM superfamily enzyme YgiQ (UPF0313 family)